MAFIDGIISSNELQSVYIEEWNGDVFYKTFSLADGDYATKMSKGSDGAYVVYMLLRKCLDADGNKLFTLADKLKLMNNFDGDQLADILVRIKGESKEIDTDNIEEAVKN